MVVLERPDGCRGAGAAIVKRRNDSVWRELGPRPGEVAPWPRSFEDPRGRVLLAPNRVPTSAPQHGLEGAFQRPLPGGQERSERSDSDPGQATSPSKSRAKHRGPEGVFRLAQRAASGCGAAGGGPDPASKVSVRVFATAAPRCSVHEVLLSGIMGYPLRPFRGGANEARGLLRPRIGGAVSPVHWVVPDVFHVKQGGCFGSEGDDEEAGVALRTVHFVKKRRRRCADRGGSRSPVIPGSPDGSRCSLPTSCTFRFEDGDAGPLTPAGVSRETHHSVAGQRRQPATAWALRRRSPAKGRDRSRRVYAWKGRSQGDFAP